MAPAVESACLHQAPRCARCPPAAAAPQRTLGVVAIARLCGSGTLSGVCHALLVIRVLWVLVLACAAAAAACRRRGRRAGPLLPLLLLHKGAEVNGPRLPGWLVRLEACGGREPSMWWMGQPCVDGRWRRRCRPSAFAAHTSAPAATWRATQPCRRCALHHSCSRGAGWRWVAAKGEDGGVGLAERLQACLSPSGGATERINAKASPDGACCHARRRRRWRPAV